MGVKRALGVDVDPDAITAARENAVLYSVSNHVELEVGSVMDVRTGQYAIRRATLVVANILAPVLVHLLGEGLGDLLAPRGKLILSGILTEQEAEVVTAVHGSGLLLEDRLQRDDWLALVVSKME